MWGEIIMRSVLLVHNYYQQGGGEDKVVAQEAALLLSKGIDVELYSVNNDVLREQGAIGKAKTALNASWSVSEFKRIKNKLMDMKPDVVHVHNFFPLISPSIYYACHSLNIPIVQTLHNYRLICPAATFLRENKVCEKCLHGSLMNSIINGCYRESKVQTLPVVSMIAINNMLGTWNNKVNRYIALTQFSKNKFVESGIYADRIAVKPNFISTQDHSLIQGSTTQKYILYVGRISSEKGVQNLLEAWKRMEEKNEVKLLIIGDGPEKDKLFHLFANDSVQFLGSQPADKVLELMKHALYLVVPSIWYEGFPMTIVEAYSVGTPVLSSRIGSLQEIVEDGRTGFHFTHDDIDDMKRVLSQALNYQEYFKLKENVNNRFNTSYTADVNYIALSNIYHDVMKEKRNEYASRL